MPPGVGYDDEDPLDVAIRNAVDLLTGGLVSRDARLDSREVPKRGEFRVPGFVPGSFDFPTRGQEAALVEGKQARYARSAAEVGDLIDPRFGGQQYTPVRQPVQQRSYRRPGAYAVPQYRRPPPVGADRSYAPVGVTAGGRNGGLVFDADQEMSMRQAIQMARPGRRLAL